MMNCNCAHCWPGGYTGTAYASGCCFAVTYASNVASYALDLGVEVGEPMPLWGNVTPSSSRALRARRRPTQPLARRRPRYERRRTGWTRKKETQRC